MRYALVAAPKRNFAGAAREASKRETGCVGTRELSASRRRGTALASLQAHPDTPEPAASRAFIPTIRCNLAQPSSTSACSAAAASGAVCR